MECLQATYKDDDEEPQQHQQKPPPDEEQPPPPEEQLLPPPPEEQQPPPPPPEEQQQPSPEEQQPPPPEEQQQPSPEEQQPPTSPRDTSLPPPPPPPTTAMEIEEPRNDTEPPRNPTENPSESPSESDRNPKTEEDEDDENDDEPDREDDELDDYDAGNGNGNPNNRKRKSLSSLTLQVPKEEIPDEVEEETLKENGISLLNGIRTGESTAAEDSKAAQAKKKSKSKKKKKTGNSVWLTRSTRKGKKKAKPTPQNTPAEDKVLITPVPRAFDKTDDSPEMSICLSKVYKAEKVELSEDRMSAGSTKGYRMVRATRGVCEGAWYYEIKVVRLGETGHTRLGWSTEKGDLQAPVGYDGSSFGYRDVDGSKVHKALREKYGEEGYKEGDVIGFYINLPEGGVFAPKPPQLVWYKGQRYLCAADPKEDPPKIVPGSEISFFKNGVCQGVAFKDLYGGRYYPAASMYTYPNQPNCEVKFNFGPDFDIFPEDFAERPVPRPMIEVPYHGYDHRVENGVSDEKKQ